jgi:hypothetical protein
LLLRYLMQHADGLSYLLYIGFAARTLCNVLLKPLSHLWKQGVFQVISDQLHDLQATKRIIDWHTPASFLALIFQQSLLNFIRSVGQDNLCLDDE